MALNVLIACEESQVTSTEFRKLGCNAFSADIQEPSGGHPEWHIHGDVIPYLNGNCTFKTMDGIEHRIEGGWDLIIAHPPCTYLTITGNRWFNTERYGQKAVERELLRKEAAEFFMRFASAGCKHIAIENPIGCMSKIYRKPNQIVQPFWFGDPHRKSTCLWLIGLPELKKTDVVDVDSSDVYQYIAKNGKVKTDSRYRSQCKNEDRSKHRSKTPAGFGKAMATQWYEYLKGLNTDGKHE